MLSSTKPLFIHRNIRGAVALHLHQTGKHAEHHAESREHLIAASNHWKQYAAQWSSQYVKQTLTRMGLAAVDIAAIQTQMDADIPQEIDAENHPAKSQ